jgi:hypothetical protein
MRVPVSLLIFGVFVMGTIAAQATEADTSCAATFTALSQSARNHGLPSAEFDNMAAIAARHGGAITSAGQSEVRDMSLPELQAKVVNCHARYEDKGGDMRVASSN